MSAGKMSESPKPQEKEFTTAGAKSRLMAELKSFQKEKWVNVEVCLYPRP
jgi:hypothetical protein